MEIYGHVQNGMIKPQGGVILPEGTEVVITVPSPVAGSQLMSDGERTRYLASLAQIDAVPNENPGDALSGADHDRALYGEAP